MADSVEQKRGRRERTSQTANAADEEKWLLTVTQHLRTTASLEATRLECGGFLELIFRNFADNQSRP